jgi:hypothetical protein
MKCLCSNTSYDKNNLLEMERYRATWSIYFPCDWNILCCIKLNTNSCTTIKLKQCIIKNMNSSINIEISFKIQLQFLGISVARYLTK